MNEEWEIRSEDGRKRKGWDDRTEEEKMERKMRDGKRRGEKKRI